MDLGVTDPPSLELLGEDLTGGENCPLTDLRVSSTCERSLEFDVHCLRRDL